MRVGPGHIRQLETGEWVGPAGSSGRTDQVVVPHHQSCAAQRHCSGISPQVTAQASDTRHKGQTNDTLRWVTGSVGPSETVPGGTNRRQLTAHYILHIVVSCSVVHTANHQLPGKPGQMCPETPSNGSTFLPTPTGVRDPTISSRAFNPLIPMHCKKKKHGVYRYVSICLICLPCLAESILTTLTSRGGLI